MRKDALNKLLKGYKKFHSNYMTEKNDAYREKAASGQSPKVMVITCSDSRVDPNIITRAGLGEIFQVANVANIVPPYKPAKNSHHSTSSALEFAVTVLNVEHIVVMGHSSCGGIQALLRGLPDSDQREYSFILSWVQIMADAAKKVAGEKDETKKQHRCEEEALKISLANLRSFPWIASREQEGKLKLHAWHFDISSGTLKAFDEKKNIFAELK